MNEPYPPFFCEILNIYSNPHSQHIIDVLQKENGIDRNKIISSTNLSRKQFYSTITKLKKASLIHKSHNKYYITLFGTLFLRVISTVKLLVNSSRELTILGHMDVIMPGLPKEEYNGLVDKLIPSEYVKRMLYIN